MSGGRVELGLGTGHSAMEHEQFGIPFPHLTERYERLEEQLAIITGMWAAPAGERFTHAGRHYQLAANPALPKPVRRPRLLILIGGRGPKRTPALAAAFADELNVSYLSPADTAAAFGRARAACRAIGRDPATLRLSVDPAARLRLQCRRGGQEAAEQPCGALLPAASGDARRPRPRGGRPPGAGGRPATPLRRDRRRARLPALLGYRRSRSSPAGRRPGPAGGGLTGCGAAAAFRLQPAKTKVAHRGHIRILYSDA